MIKTTVDHMRGIVMIWVSRDTAEASFLVEHRRQAEKYPRYFIAVLRSGGGDLAALTQDLIRQNVR